LKRPDWIGMSLVLLSGGALILYRANFVEPPAWGDRCALAAASHPIACGLRAGFGWVQGHALWGLASLACAAWAFLGGPFAARVAAVALGVAGAINYNVTWGVLGAAIGVWVWLRPPPARGTRA
jgi:hypothetical protein